MLKVFVKFWNHISEAGINAVETPREKRDVRLLNRGWFILLCIQSGCLVAHLLHGLYSTAFLTGIFVIGLLSIRVLLRLGKINVAKITAIGVINWNTITMAIFMGAQTHVIDFLLLTALMPLYFFEMKNRLYIFWGITVSLLPYVLFNAFASYLTSYALPVEQQIEVYKTTPVVMFFSLSALLFLIYHKNADYEADGKLKEAQLGEQKKLYERILEQIPIDIVTFDKEFRYSYVNSTAVRDAELRQWLIGKTNKEYFAARGLSMEKADEREQLLHRALEKQAAVQSEETLVDRVGQIKHTLKGASPVFSENKGELICLVGYSLDITPIKEAEAKMKAYAHELEKTNDALRHFVHATSHDLKTPLRNIASFLQLIEKRNVNNLDDNSKSMITHTIKSVRHLNRLIHDIYQYSVADDDSQEVYIADFNQVLANVMKQMSITLADKNACIQSASLPMLEVAPDHIALVFRNLIGNAVKYNSSMKPELKINYAITDTEYIFSFADNGIGIDEQYREQIFEMFQRLHNMEEYDGTGMGLAICNRIIGNYGGKIWVESEKGKGSIFYFTLLKEMVAPEVLIQKHLPFYSEMAVAS